MLATITVAAALAASRPRVVRGEGSGSVVVDPILVQRGNVTIRKSDFDAEILRIPEKDRETFLSSDAACCAS